jgi:hypothetical protein
MFGKVNSLFICMEPELNIPLNKYSGLLTRY